MAKPYSDEQIAALRNAVASGVRRVTVGQQTTEYQTTADLQKALSHMVKANKDYEASVGGTARPMTVPAITVRN